MNVEEMIPFVFPVVFVPFWMTICLGLSRSSGWNELAQRWEAPERGLGPAAPLRYFQSGAVGKVSFGGALITGADPSGLYLDVLLPFRYGFRPLLIPWDQLEYVGPRAFFMDEVKASNGGSLRLRRTEYRKLLELGRQRGAELEHLVPPESHR